VWPRHALPLSRGDVAVHSALKSPAQTHASLHRTSARVTAPSHARGQVHGTDVQHGVMLGDEHSARWSLILWIRDSDTCDAHNQARRAAPRCPHPL